MDRFYIELHNLLDQVAKELKDIRTIMARDSYMGVEEIKLRHSLLVQRVFARREALAEAKHQIGIWNELEKSMKEETVLGWKARREVIKLQDRADRAEAFAAAMLVLAKHAIETTEGATLTAWLARYDANVAG